MAKRNQLAGPMMRRTWLRRSRLRRTTLPAARTPNNASHFSRRSLITHLPPRTQATTGTSVVGAGAFGDSPVAPEGGGDCGLGPTC